MSGSTLAIVIIPIVAGAGLVIFLSLVLFNANRRPGRHGRGREPQQPVAGGIIRGDPRQMTAGRDVPASGEITPQRAPTDHSEGG